MVWQDRFDLGVRVTWFSDERAGEYETTSLPGAGTFLLGAATSDPDGNLFVILIEAGDGAPETAREAFLVAFDGDAAERNRRPLDTSREGLNIVRWGTTESQQNHVTMRWSGGHVGVMLARTMLRSGDGLNHQGGIALVYDASTLQVSASERV